MGDILHRDLPVFNMDNPEEVMACEDYRNEQKKMGIHTTLQWIRDNTFRVIPCVSTKYVR